MTSTTAPATLSSGKHGAYCWIARFTAPSTAKGCRVFLANDQVETNGRVRENKHFAITTKVNETGVYAEADYEGICVVCIDGTVARIHVRHLATVFDVDFATADDVVKAAGGAGVGMSTTTLPALEADDVRLIWGVSVDLPRLVPMVRWIAAPPSHGITTPVLPDDQVIAALEGPGAYIEVHTVPRLDGADWDDRDWCLRVAAKKTGISRPMGLSFGAVEPGILHNLSQMLAGTIARDRTEAAGESWGGLRHQERQYRSWQAGSELRGLDEIAIRAALAERDPSTLVRPVYSRFADPVGAVEIAERLGVARATVDQWRQRSLLPDPEWIVGGRPAWRWETVAAWAAATDRL